MDKPRLVGKIGGGGAVIHRLEIKTTLIPIQAPPSFESLCLKLSGLKPLVIAVIYRPPKPHPTFLSDLSEFLTQLTAISPSALLLGDFNVHMDSTTCTMASELLEILSFFKITQHIDFPTHNKGHTLDLVCSSGATISHIAGIDLTSLVSDHLAITFTIDTPSPIEKQKRTITFRNLKSINTSSLSTSLSTIISDSSLTQTVNPTDLVNLYNNSLSSCLDHLAPKQTRSVSFTHTAPWYTDELHLLKRKGRQLERLAKKTGLTIHKDIHTQHLQLYKNTLISTRSSHFSEIIQSGNGNPKVLFSTINKLLKPMDTISRSFTEDKCNKFLSFFHDKINTIHQQLSISPPPDNLTPPPLPTHSFSTFQEITPSDLSSVVAGMTSSTCSLDPLPTFLLKDCLPTLSPLITKTVNASLSSGSVPPPLKLAAVTPILKKPGLDPDSPNNYRPISNLPFLSKILERTVTTQITTYLESNKLFELFQSGFRSKHSTETALLKVTNDLLLSSDTGSLNIVILLDLTAAFDTISHPILLSRLKSTLGITDTALSWFTSYLSDRQQYISINNCKSSTTSVTHGVPQGSVLGPLLFIIYILPLGQILRRHGLHFHCYADDTQLYLPSKTITATTHSTLTTCLTEIKNWMQNNFLKLNCNKSEIIIIGPDALTRSTVNFSLNIDNSIITPSAKIRNLGVIMDPKLSFQSHVNHITKTAFFHLRNIARLRPTLSQPAAETLIHAFITSRLDYCNSLLYGATDKVLKKLQYVQNSAARLLTRTRSRDHITPVLHDLHWLPIKSRIDYKILITTYKSLNNQAPQYLCDLVKRHVPSRSLRSENAKLLEFTYKAKKRTWGDRSFTVAAPTLWNPLPLHIKEAPTLAIFKTSLKTHLFRLAFPT